jgi:hypothetical protein
MPHPPYPYPDLPHETYPTARVVSPRQSLPAHTIEVAYLSIAFSFFSGEETSSGKDKSNE